jgi:hypothetical protein
MQLLKAKHLVVDVLRYMRNAKTLVEALETPPTDVETAAHRQYELKSQENESKQGYRPRIFSVSGISLAGLQQQALQEVGNAEAAGLATRSDDYQAILNLIAADFREQHKIRKQRSSDLQRLGSSKQGLAIKAAFLQQRHEDYTTYLQTCIHKQSKYGGGNRDEQPQQKVIKYTAVKLASKGVLAVLTDLSPIKTVNFVFTQLNSSLVRMSAHFPLRTVSLDLHLDELLRMQYEGLRTAPLIARCEFHVELLIHMLNKKFFH